MPPPYSPSSRSTPHDGRIPTLPALQKHGTSLATPLMYRMYQDHNTYLMGIHEALFGDDSLRMRTLKFSFPFQIRDLSVVLCTRNETLQVGPHGGRRGADCGEVSQRASQEAGWRPPLHLEPGGLVVRRPCASQLPLPRDKRHAHLLNRLPSGGRAVLFTSTLPRWSFDPATALP